MAHALQTADLMAARVAEIEQCLHGLDEAFVSSDMQRIEHQCQALQRSLADSLVVFRQAEHAGLVPLSLDLIQRLKLAQARVVAQSAAVHRAQASIDRTLDVLFPGEAPSTYGKLGQSPAAKALSAYR